MSAFRTPLTPSRLAACVAATAVFLIAGCPGIGDLLSDIQSIRVEIVNDTSFSIDPNIRYDDDAGFLAGLFPAESLDTGLIAPGEMVTYTFECDQLGLVLSDEAEQIVPLIADYVLDATDIIERDDEYECGDRIRFLFVGNGLDFGVIVSVNGRVVD